MWLYLPAEPMIREIPFIVPNLSVVTALLTNSEPAVIQVTTETRMVSNNVSNRDHNKTGLWQKEHVIYACTIV